MNLTSLIYKNMKGLRYKYVTFLLSSVFSVTIFYLFASFVMHPNVEFGSSVSETGVQIGLLACEIIIVIFSFFFVWYSSSAFIKSRANEFGLLSTLGASRRQLSKMIFTESVIIGEIAIGLGLLLGTLLLRMFLSAMSLLLKVDSPIEFAIVSQAILYTFIGYSLLFVFVALINVRGLKKGQIVDLSRQSQKAKKPPAFSWILGLFALLCLGVGYYLAWTTDGRTVLLRILPVIGIVCVGTYFLFSQVSVGFLQTIKRNKGVYYRGPNLLTVSELGFKVQDDVRVLSITAILTAVVLTAIGTLNIFSQTLVEMCEFAYPQALSVTIDGKLEPHELEKIELALRSEFQSDGIHVQSGAVLPGIMFRGAVWDMYNVPVPLISEEDYKVWAEESGAPYVEDVLPGEAVMVGSYAWADLAHTLHGDLQSRVSGVDGELHESGISFVVCESIDIHLLNDPYSGVLVIDSTQMADLSQVAGPRDNLTLISFEFSNWTESSKSVEKISDLLSAQIKDLDFEILSFSSRVSVYQEAIQSRNLMLFLAVFVALVFSVGMGSMLHFRLFTDLEEDRSRFASMKRLGVSWGEIKAVITRQAAMLFFAPFALGVVHSAFALEALIGTLLSDPVIAEIGLPVLTSNKFRYMAVPIAIFLALQTIYFLISRKAYLDAMRSSGDGSFCFKES